MSTGARAALGVGTLLILLGFGWAVWWLFAPNYQLLFGNLREKDAAEITTSLAEWKVPYKLVQGGSGIEVPSEVVYDTRMKLVSAGVPSGGHVGFELFDDADFGVTEFAQRVNYQRAMQGELERSIAALPGVESVRVHLTIRRPGLFLGQQDGSKASVAVTMVPGEMLRPAQVSGIRNLVASAVDGLDATAVVVVGPGGVVVGGGSSDRLVGQDADQSEYEARVRTRVSDLLEQVFNLREFRVSVDARMNFDQIHRVSERLLAQGENGNGLLNRRHSTRSGSPPSNEGQTAGAQQQSEDLEYAHGSEREETAVAPGRIERLSVAVLVPESVNTLELARLRRLVAVAAGIDETRGDRLEIGSFANPNSSVNPDAPQPAAVGRAQPVTDRTLTLPLIAVGVVGLLLGWALARLSRPTPPTLRPHERDAILSRMRAWLAEGEQA